MLNLQREDRIERKESLDAERDQQIEEIWKTVDQLRKRLNALELVVALMRQDQSGESPGGMNMTRAERRAEIDRLVRIANGDPDFIRRFNQRMEDAERRKREIDHAYRMRSLIRRALQSSAGD